MFKKRCRHRLIAKKAQKMMCNDIVSIECFKCRNVYVADYPFAFEGITDRHLYICDNCLDGLVCPFCRKEIKDEFYIGECVRCNEKMILCPKCAHKKAYAVLDAENMDPNDIAKRIYLLVKELVKIDKKDKNWLKKFLSKDDKSDISEALFPLIMNINLYFSNVYEEEFFDDDWNNEDWWIN